MSLIVNGKTMLGYVPGVGVPKSGEKGQLLVKSGTEDYRTEWKNPTEVIPYYSNPNLLDNWYFIGGGSQQGGGQFPINQRGKTNYTTNGYTIDRWKATNLSNISLGEDGITIESLRDSFIAQQIDNPNRFAKKQITISALIKNVDIVSGNLSIRIRFNNDWTGYHVNYTENGLISFTMTAPTEIDSMEFEISNMGESKQTIKAAKLELGDNQTLAHKEGDTWALNDPAPNYAMELAKCQRYQYNPFYIGSKKYNVLGFGFASSGIKVAIYINTPTTGRANATISFKNLYLRKRKDTKLIPVSKMAFASINAGGVVVTCDESDETYEAFEMYELLSFSEEGELFFDMNL